MRYLIKFTSLAVPFFMSAALFSACTTNQQNLNDVEPLIFESKYKRSIQFITDDDALKTSLIKMVAQNAKELVVFPENSHSEFRLILTKNVERVKSLETKPRLFGYIQKDESPVNVSLQYTLQKSSAHVIDSGTFEEVANTTQTIYPRISSQTTIPAERLNVISLKILNEVRKRIASTTWSAEIIGQKDPFHVTMSGSPLTGLNLGDRFITKTQPVSTLELAMFEETANGETRPVLRLLSGPLPTTGKSLEPIDAGKPIK